MKSPWQALKGIFAARRGEDPQREVRWVSPYPIAGVQLSADQSLSLSTVWACIDIIAKSVAACEWKIYEPIAGTKRRRLRDEDIRSWLLNTRPNAEMTAIGFREALLFQAIPYGNAYAEIVRDAGGKVSQLWPLMSDRMTPRRDPKTWELLYHYAQPDGSVEVMSQRRVLHIRGGGLWGLMGENIIARAAKTLGTAAAQERFSASFFGQGAQPSGVLEFPGKLTPDMHKRLKEDWADKHSGPNNMHKPLILEAGMKFSTTSTDPQKSQLVESKKFTVEEICRWFGVPPHKVQHLEHATFSNIEHSSIEFVRDALRPWERRLCQEVDFKLFDQTRAPWLCTEIDLSPLTRGDAQSRALAQASWRQNGIMTANEIRASEGLDDCGDDGDVLIVQSNMTTIEKILNDVTDPTDTELDPSVEDEREEPPESEDLEVEVEDVVDSVRMGALKSALACAFDRYERSLKNRVESLRFKEREERSQLLLSFKHSQRETIARDLSHFASLFGRQVSADDAGILLAAYESGVALEALPLSLPPPQEKKPC